MDHPNKIYKLLRDPHELEKAASSFAGVPLLAKHVYDSAGEIDPTLVIGTTGSRAEYEHPHLRNSVTIWEKNAIANIEAGKQAALSAGYSFDADMTPGTFAGQRYDGVMRNIAGHHLALVPKSRAGADVVIGASVQTAAYV